MFKKLIAISALISSTAIADEKKEIKYLHYKFNDSVVITISNVNCPYPQIKDEYPFAVMASRIDGKHLTGCYKNKDDNDLVIQWNHGDTTTLPANAFLQKPIELKVPAPKIDM